MNCEKRIKIRPAIRLKIAASQKYTCYICKMLLGASFHIDHKIALCCNGNNSLDNLGAICPNCHAEKTVIDIQKYHDKKTEIRTGKSRFFNPMAYECNIYQKKILS